MTDRASPTLGVGMVGYAFMGGHRATCSVTSTPSPTRWSTW